MPSEPSNSTKENCQLNENLIALLADNGIKVNHDICQNIEKPPLHIVYLRYISAHEILRQIDLMQKDQTWVESRPTKMDIINLFVARSTWHKQYATKIPAAEKHEDMRSWLAEEVGCLSDLELWGEKKDNYVMKDLEEWLEKKDGKKTKVVSSAKAKDIKKGNKEATMNTDNSKAKVQGSTKGKEKQEEPKATTQHKKKTRG
jgi:ABC-type antimicrobial peptide transport system permease subunit